MKEELVERKKPKLHSEECECGETIGAFSDSMLVHNMKLHRDSKGHKKIMEIIEKIRAEK